MKLPGTKKAPLAVFRFPQSVEKSGAKKGQKAPLSREIARSCLTRYGCTVFARFFFSQKKLS